MDSQATTLTEIRNLDSTTAAFVGHILAYRLWTLNSDSFQRRSFLLSLHTIATRTHISHTQSCLPVADFYYLVLSPSRKLNFSN